MTPALASDGPYRSAPPPVLHVCIVCFERYTWGPSVCRPCRVPRLATDQDEIRLELLAEVYRRIAAPARWKRAVVEAAQLVLGLLVPGLITLMQPASPPRIIPRLARPTDRDVEDHSTGELVELLGMTEGV
jgi:hypothetical protein